MARGKRNRQRELDRERERAREPRQEGHARAPEQDTPAEPAPHHAGSSGPAGDTPAGHGTAQDTSGTTTTSANANANASANARMLYIHARSPLHTGTGQSSGIIDLPVSREIVTGWPDLPGSTIKGVLRDRCAPPKGDPAEALFNAAFGEVTPEELAAAAGENAEDDADDAGGADDADDAEIAEETGDPATAPEEPDAATNGSGQAPAASGAAGGGRATRRSGSGAGMLWFTDAHLLCLPVRSFYGSFAWLTCPLALRRWQRDHAAAGLPCPAGAPPVPNGIDRILLPRKEGLTSVIRDSATATVFLEDLDLQATDDATVTAFACAIAEAVFDQDWQGEFVTRFAVVSDDLFGFLSETATEVNARIRIDDRTRTVADGALWYEESLPAESILAAPLLAAPRRGLSASALLDVVADRLDGLVQIGGQASVGRGLVRMHLHGGTP